MSYSDEYEDESYEEIIIEDTEDNVNKLLQAQEKLDTLRLYSWNKGMNLFTSNKCVYDLVNLF